jgi:hypothetical protein
MIVVVAFEKIETTITIGLKGKLLAWMRESFAESQLQATVLAFMTAPF